MSASTAADLASGKGHSDENFPVASVLIAPQFRAPVMAYYRFARLADDIADHETAPAAEKLARLEAMRAGNAKPNCAGLTLHLVARRRRQAQAARTRPAISRAEAAGTGPRAPRSHHATATVKVPRSLRR